MTTDTTLAPFSAFQAIVEDPEELRGVLEAVFGGPEAQLSFRRDDMSYRLALAGPTGWLRYDRRINNTPLSHAVKIQAWRRGMSHQKVAASIAQPTEAGVTRCTAFSLIRTREHDGDRSYDVITVKPAWV